MRDTSLHISLGHNSSALMAVDGVVVRGYEQERIDRVKNSSAYPAGAIELATGHNVSIDRAYVSHWFDHFDLKELPPEGSKYLDMAHLRSMAIEVHGLHRDFTHHDAHAHSAVAFARGQGVQGPACVIVADGFGNLQECLSVYELDGNLALKHRAYGFKKSLGLMYQYATDFLGLKMNQDEYKLLGYEAHILDYITVDEALTVQHKIAAQAELHAEIMAGGHDRYEATDHLIDYEELALTKTMWTKQFRAWMDMFPPIADGRSIGTSSALVRCYRTHLAFCVQTFLEAAMAHLVWKLAPPSTQFILTGGVFYNVKLNRRIQTMTGSRVFAHPLAGDQGASLGMGDRPALLTLCIGERGWRQHRDLPVGMRFVEHDEWVSVAADHLARNDIVNLVRGHMEFGPRALCNTSTLANPDLSNVAHINLLNERDEAMPMAPVMSRTAARTMLSEELDFIKGSEKYMITTVAWNGKPTQQMMGVAHRDPLQDVWTCRPQVVPDHIDPELLELLGSVTRQTLINTSFNYHGEPIVMTLDHAMRTHSMQCLRAQTMGIRPPVTLMVVEL